MIVKGVRETDGENCEKTVNDLFIEKLGVGPFKIQDTRYKMILSFHVYNYTHIRHLRYLDTKQYLTI